MNKFLKHNGLLLRSFLLTSVSGMIVSSFGIGGQSLKFMDLLIKIVNGKLETTVYSKPTDGHLYLHNDSCHPRSTKLGVEKGVALRLRRICSTEEEFERQSKNYMAFLANREHPHQRDHPEL